MSIDLHPQSAAGLPAMRGIVLALWLVLLVLSIVLIGRAHYSADLSAFLPSHPTEEQAVLIEQLREGPASKLILIGIEAIPGNADPSASETQLAQLSKALAKRLRHNPAFASINNGEAVTAAKDRALLLEHRYLLSPAITPERFSVAGLHAALEQSIDVLSSSAGLGYAALLPRDPTGELLQVLRALDPQLDAVDAGAEIAAPSEVRSLVDGVWMNAASPTSSRRALLLTQTRADGADIDAQEVALASIRAAYAQSVAELDAKAINTAPMAPNITPQLLISGPGVFAVASRNTIKSEATRLSLIGSLIIVALLLSIYRSLRALLLGLLPMASGALAGIAAVSLVFGTVHGITLAFGVTLIGEAVDYAIYLFVQQGGAVPASTSNAGQRFWPTIRLGVLTSIIGFSSMLFSGFPGLAQLGLFSIVGIVTAASVTRWILPLLMPKNFQVKPTPRLGALLLQWTQQAPRLRGLVFVLSLIAVVILSLHHAEIWNRELSALSPVPLAEQQLDARLRADLGAPDVRSLVVVQAIDAEAALQASEQVVAALTPLIAQGQIGGIEAPSRYLPSVATQLRRRAALPEASSLHANFIAAAQGLPLDAGSHSFDAFFVDVAAAKTSQTLNRADLEGSSLALGVDALLHQNGRAWTALIALRPATTLTNKDAAIDSTKIRAALQALPSIHVRVLDLKLESAKLYNDYLNEALRLALIGAFVIVIMLAVMLRSFKRLVRVCAPLVAAVLVVSASLIALGISLTIFHLIGLLLIVAVGSNYALFFDRRSTDEGAPEDASEDTSDENSASVLTSLLFANFTTIAGFGLLAFSNVPVLNAIGSTVGPGAFLTLIFTAILVSVRSSPRHT